MVIEIWLPFFNHPLNHFYSPLVTKFGLLVYNQGLDKLTKELCMLTWCLKSSYHFLMIQIVFKSFFSIIDQILVVRLQSGSQQVDQNIVDVEMVIEIQQPFFNDLDFYFIFTFIALATKFKSLNYYQGLDRSTKKLWSLRWQLNFTIF